MARLTPMFRQYLEIKNRYPDAILFFRLGDFYEMFFEDAEVASRILDIALTSRDKGAKEKVPMCGVPAANAAPYINRLVEAGYKVAICEQVEDPRQAKGLVKREVIRVITPGLNVDQDSLTAKDYHFLAAISQGKRLGLALLDLSTGEFWATELTEEEELLSELFRREPKEILIPEELKESSLLHRVKEILPTIFVSPRPGLSFEPKRAEGLLKEHYQVLDLSAFGLNRAKEALSCAGALLEYVKETQKMALEHLSPVKFYHLSRYLVIDEATKRNLELLRNNLDGTKKGSLLWVLDQTLTPMGGRLLKHWLLYPLRDLEGICARHRAVEFLLEHYHLRQDLRAELKKVSDLERLAGRCAMRLANPRDLLALRDSLRALPKIHEALSNQVPGLLEELRQQIHDLSDLAEKIEHTLREEAPVNIKEGGLIKEGVHPELDELRRLKTDGLSFLSELEARERKRTGIPNLKVGYNRIFGYYIEVSKSHLKKVPPDYIRKQTLVGGERFITQELKEFEAKVLSADERLKELEYQLFVELREEVAGKTRELKETAKALATLDVLAALAEVAAENGYVRPEMTAERVIEIREGRHPVVEKTLPTGQFVPNDIRLDDEENIILIITGPNMAGKSTILRQTALITLMAHMGSFVPAEYARIGLCDRIFTRVGASDQLSRGRSTFMVEMTECAHILHQATKQSLVVLDEIGRGTSTFDGLSIAWAVAEYLVKRRVRTLFATHYHELTELARENAGVKNYNVAVKEWEDSIVFLYRLLPGPVNESYGIQVAALAGLPKEVVKRAKEILARLEQKPDLSPRQKQLALPLFQSDGKLKQKLQALDPNRMTPLEALECLFELKRLAEESS